MDRLQAEAALSRAMELDAEGAGDRGFDRALLQRLALELGVTSEAVDRAVDEVLSAPAGPLNAAATRTIDAPVAAVAPALESMLRLRGLTTEGSGVWYQDSGWWPDLFRYRSVSPVAASVLEAGAGTTVRFVARLDRIWRTHLVAAILVPVVAAILLGVAQWAAWLVVSVGWIVLAAAGYQYRREAIRRRLDRALRELSRAEYRRQPW